MANYRYETHKMPDPLLPFIFHRRFEVRQLDKHPNWHENIELLQAIEGSGYVRCGADCVPFSEGDLFVINADMLHSIGTNDRLVYRCLIVDNSFFTTNGIPVASLYFRNVVREEEVYRLFNEVVHAYEHYDTEDYRTVLAIRVGVLRLLQVLCADHTTRRPATASNEYVKQAIIYIRRNLANHICLDQIADHLGLSKYHLARQFRLHTGKTIVQTLNLMRCTEAQRLMEGGMSVSAAAAACGFENLSYFTRTYKVLMGKLPSQTRKR